MGFTLRLILGYFLVLLLCATLQGSPSRQIRQTNESLSVDNSTKSRNEISDKNNDKIENVELKKDKNGLAKSVEEEISKPKTESDSKALPDKKTEEITNKKTDASKLKLSQTFSKNGNTTNKEAEEKTSKETVDNIVIKQNNKLNRKDNSRSIDVDINKYVSPDFHNRNNVFTLPNTPENEKFIEPDFQYHSSTYNSNDNTKFDFTSELTTPKNDYFDNKYKEAVESVDQKLEHIDFTHPKEPIKENKELNVEELIEQTKNDQINANLDYVKVKNLESNNTENKNSKHKDLVVEQATKLNFETSYNNTKIINDKPVEEKNKIAPKTQDLVEKPDRKTDLEKSETSTPKNTFIPTTRKSVTLTKPPTDKNNSYILNNKIETETIKAINEKNSTPQVTEKPKDEEKFLVNITAKASSVTVTKRGSIKFADYATTTPLPGTSTTSKRTRNKIASRSKINKDAEQVVQENQIIPIIHVTVSDSSFDSTTTSKVFTTSDRNLTEVPKVENVTSNFVLKTNGTESVSEKPKLENATDNIEIITETTVIGTTTNEIYSTTNDVVTEALVTTTILPDLTTTIEAQKDDLTTTIAPVTTEADEETTFTKTTEESTSEVPSTTEGTQSDAAVNENTETIPSTTASLKTEPTDVTTTLETSTDQTTESGSRTSKGISFDNVSTVENKIEQQTTEIPTTTELLRDDLTTLVPPGNITENTINVTSTEANQSSPVILESTTFTVTTNWVPVSNKTPQSTTNEDSVTDYEDPDEEVTNEDEKKPPSTSTTEIVFVHIENVDSNHTTFVPEVINPSYNYSLPESRNIPVSTSTEDNMTETPTENGLVDGPSDNKGTIAAIVISSVGAVCLILLAGLLYVMRKRQKHFNYGQRCTPVSLDDYSMDNMSVYNSVSRRKGVLRVSKRRTYGNPAFEDPVAVTHPLNFPALAKFATNLEDIKAEYDEIPQITARTSELPEGCEPKNRYANVIPLPETRVFLNPIDGYPNSDYINANYVTGPKDSKGYYIACQGPMQSTVDDFWRMIWEQQSKVVLMITHLFENGIEKCTDYLPPSEVLDCHRLFGDFQVTLKKREVKEKYVISSLQLKNMVSNSWREITHFWYLGWPEKGVPTEANSLIAFIIEARSYMKSSTIDKRDIDTSGSSIANGSTSTEINPVVVHCSPGTGRTGVLIACDIAIREFEQTRLVDVPKIVYKIRRDRASSVQTREQYEFIYKVVSLYATKLTGGALDSF